MKNKFRNWAMLLEKSKIKYVIFWKGMRKLKSRIINENRKICYFKKLL